MSFKSLVCHHPTFRFRKKRGFISYYRQRLQLNSVRCDFTVFHQDTGLNPTSLTSLAARWPCQLCRSVPPSSVLCCPLIPHFSPPSKSDHWAWGTHTTLAQAHLRASASRVSVPWIAVIKEAKLSPEGGASSAVLSRNFNIVLASRGWGDGLPQSKVPWKPFFFHTFIENPCPLAMLHAPLLFLNAHNWHPKHLMILWGLSHLAHSPACHWPQPFSEMFSMMPLMICQTPVPSATGTPVFHGPCSLS